MSFPRHLLALALLLSSAPALAQSSAAEAEHVRLTEEMKRLTGRNAWRGVDESYRRLEALEEQGVKLTYRDHYMGAVAARELGDVNAVYIRVKRAQSVEDTEEIRSWVADLDANFGEVHLKADGKYSGDRSLNVAEMPFDPGQRRVIEAAQVAVRDSRVYDGILPLGAYTFGGQTFEVVAGAAPVTRTLQAQSMRDQDGGGGGLSYVGPRVDLGLAVGMAGEPNSADQADGFGGMGGRIGLGVELGLSTRFGVVAQVGYHNLYSGAPEGTPPTLSALDDTTSTSWVAPPTRNNLQLGFGWLAGAVRLGDLRIAAGPTYAVGVAKAVGSVPDDGGGATGSSDGSTAQQYLSGKVRVGGAELGLFYGFLNFGNLQSGVGLHAGAFTDSGRWYSWGQLAFTLAPAAYRRDG